MSRKKTSRRTRKRLITPTLSPKGEREKGDVLRAPLMLLTFSLASGAQLIIDGINGNVKLAVGGVWYRKSFDEFVASFTAKSK